jgi:putative oxidoreductase
MGLSDLGLLILRLAVGLTFAAHGAQKAFGWWGGPGPEGWHGAMQKMGFQPAPFFAVLSTAVELMGGICIAIGFLTPFAAAALVAQAVVIVVQAHWSKGFFNAAGGYEFPLGLGAVALALALLGAGAISLDALLGLGWSSQLRLTLAMLGILGGLVGLAVPRLASRRIAAGGNGLRRT